MKIVLHYSNFWGEVQFLLGIYEIFKVFSKKLLRQLPWCRPIKTTVIWITKQIKMPKIVETFSWKISMKFTRYYYWSRSPTMTMFLENLFFLELQNTQLSLQSTRNCLLLILNASLVLDKKPLLYSLSEPAPNRNSEEQLSGNYPRKKCVGKVPF